MTTSARGVSIREVGPRDGLQIEAPIPTEAKLELIDALARTGVPRIEVASFVSPKAIPALADAEKIAEQLYRWPDVQFSALVAGMGGVHRALDAGVNRIEFVVSASDGHSKANVGRGSDESVALVERVVELVHAVDGHVELMVGIAFDCPYDGPTSPDRVAAIAAQARDAGVDSLTLADTIGTATPAQTSKLVETVSATFDVSEMGIHLHDTRGQGLANAWEAYRMGIRQIDASVGGLGGCPYAPGASGNIATEELAYMFKGSEIATGIDIDKYIAATKVASNVLGRQVESKLSLAGCNVSTTGAMSLLSR